MANDAAVAPAPEPSIAQPGITVKERRLSEDERIQILVMDKLASNPTLPSMERHTQPTCAGGT